jgi:hypothetical protein
MYQNYVPGWRNENTNFSLSSVVFTSSTMTCYFNNEPSVGDYFKIFNSPTVQSYIPENITLIGVTGTYNATYDSSTSILTIEAVSTATPTPTNTVTPTSTPTNTVTPTPTLTPTIILTNTPTPTLTPTPTSTV